MPDRAEPDERDRDEVAYQKTRARVIAGKASVQEAQGFIDFIEGAIPDPRLLTAERERWEAAEDELREFRASWVQAAESVAAKKTRQVEALRAALAHAADALKDAAEVQAVAGCSTATLKRARQDENR
jgi:hypothetical protein